MIVRRIYLVFSLALLCGACALTRREDLSTLMGVPSESGLLVIQCSMIEKKDNFLASDDIKYIYPAKCFLLAKEGGSQPIEAKRLRSDFVYPSLRPGLYCIQSIDGQLAEQQSIKGQAASFTTVRNFAYSFPSWRVREVIIDVPAGVPTYFGEIVITEPYERSGGDIERAVTRVGKSEVAEIIPSSVGERTAWKALLDKYPESPWCPALRARLEALHAK